MIEQDNKREELHQLDEFGDFVVSGGHLDRIFDYDHKVDHLNTLIHSLRILCDAYIERQRNRGAGDCIGNGFANHIEAIERQRSNGEPVGVIKEEIRFEDGALVHYAHLHKHLPVGTKLFTAPQQSPIPQGEAVAWGYSEKGGMSAYRADVINNWRPENKKRMTEPLYAAPSAPIEAQQSVTQALEQAAKICDAEADGFYERSGTLDPETNAIEFRNECAGSAYNLCQELAESIRALIPSTQAPKEVAK